MGRWGKILGLSFFMVLCIFSLFTDVTQLTRDIISIQPNVFIWITVILSLLIISLVLAMILPVFLNRHRSEKGREMIKSARNKADEIVAEAKKEKALLEEAYLKKDDALRKKLETLTKEHAEKMRVMKRQNIELKETVSKLMSEYKKSRGG